MCTDMRIGMSVDSLDMNRHVQVFFQEVVLMSMCICMYVDMRIDMSIGMCIGDCSSSLPQELMSRRFGQHLHPRYYQTTLLSRSRPS